ncbi:methyltransferase [Rhodohalobacter sp.]|uniref:methyltransferase n=1 Tax=Rhodohalobacter sp. TaxID=1974210 RepID=UPI002ACDDD2C|nr:methyltransferase [Rhodohalobacter sp.]MDZ7757421.1 methyltransferase domain-containing protein [Rhodohalobacter sp.]
MDFPKQQIVNRFSESAQDYDQFARIQEETAERLAKALSPWQFSIPEGPVIEVGAGTGLLTQHIAKMYSNREVLVTDASDEMLQLNKKKLSDHTHLQYQNMDVESAEWEEEKYSLITSNFLLHWLKHPAETVAKMLPSLKPGGLLLMSFPGDDTFPQWRKNCLDLGLPYTGNPLPDLEEIVIKLSMGPVKVDYYEDQTNLEYSSVYEFYRELKNSGSGTSLTGKKLSTKQLRLLDNYWREKNNGKVNVHYHTAFIAVKRDL